MRLALDRAIMRDDAMATILARRTLVGSPGFPPKHVLSPAVICGKTAKTARSNAADGVGGPLLHLWVGQRLMIGGRVQHLDRGDIRDKSSALLVARDDDTRKTVITEQLSACGIGDHNLTAAERRIKLAGAKH
jgi:hypothetical protein